MINGRNTVTNVALSEALLPHSGPLSSLTSVSLTEMDRIWWRAATRPRRDDLQSLGYLMIYFLRGDIHGRGYDQSVEMMKNSTIEDLCSGLPDEFATYLNYTRSLEFEDEPDYNYLQEIFRDLYVNKGFKDDNVFDWIVRRYEMNCHATNQAV